MSSSHTLYRLFNEKGLLLYVGRTIDVATRLRSHQAKKDWWSDVSMITLERHDSAEVLREAERAAIRDERPHWNANFNQSKRRVCRRGHELAGANLDRVGCLSCRRARDEVRQHGLGKDQIQQIADRNFAQIMTMERL